MPRRIEVTPSSDGTIVLVCGDEVLELLVRAAPPPPPPPGGSSGRHLDTGTRYTFAMPEILGAGDVEWLTNSLVKEYRNADTPQFEAVVLQSPSVDVHGVARLADRLGNELPGIELAVDLRPVL